MSDFLSSCFKGVFPFFFFFAVIGITVRIKKHQWKTFDSLLLILFFFYEILTACLPWIFYGEWTISTRYLIIGIPLYFPFAAIGLDYFLHIKSRTMFIKILKSSIICIILTILVCKMYSPIFKWHSSSKKQNEKFITFTSAQWILKDWNNQNYPPLTQYRCDEYQSGKRPLIESPWERIGYFSGGQMLPNFLKATHIKADYIISQKTELPSGYCQAHKINTRKGTIFIYKLIQ